MAARGRKRKNSSESGSQNEPNTREDGSEISSEVPTNVVSPTRNAAGRRKSKSGFGCTSCSASQKESHKIREGLEITVELPEIGDSPKKVSGNRRKSKNNADNRKEDSGEIPVEVRENVVSPKKNAGRKRKTKKASQSEHDTVEDGAEISAEMEENEARKKRNIRNVAGSQSEPESHEDEANVSADVPKDDGSPKKKVGSRKNNRNCSAGSNREESEIPLEMSRPGLKKGGRKRKSEIGSDDGRKEPESKEVAMNASRLEIAENAGKSPIHATETGKKKKRADSAESNADSEGGQKSRKLKVNDDNGDDGDEDSVRVEDAVSDEKDKDRPGSKRIRKLIRTKRQRKTSLTSAENHQRRKRTNKTKEETDGDRSVENVKGKTFAEDIFNKKCNLDSDSDDEPLSSLKNNNNNANEEMMLSALRTGGHQKESGEKNSNFKTSDCTETKDEEIAMEIDDSAAQVGVDIVEDSGRNEVDKKDVENKDLIGESLSADAPSARDLSADDPSAHDPSADAPSADAPSADSPSAPSPAVQRNLRSRRIATSEQVLSLKQRHLRASKRSKYVRQIITKTVESALRRSPSNRRAMPLRITRSLSSSGQRRGSNVAAVVKEDGVVTEAKKCVDADAAAAVETDATPATPPMTDASETTEDPESETPRSVSKVPPGSRVLFTTTTTQQSSPVAKSLATRLLEQVRHRATKQTTDKQQTTKPTPRSFTDPPKPNRGLTKFHSRSGVVLIRDAGASSPSTTLQRMTHMRPPRRQLMISPARPEPIVVHSHVHSPTASPSGSILKKRPPCDSDEQEIPSPSDLSRRVSFNENVDVRKLLSSGRISPKPVNRCLEMPKQQTTPATTHPPSPLAATKCKTTTPDIDTAALQFSPILNKNKTEASAESESVPVPFLPGDNSCTADSGNQFSNDSLTAAASQLNSSQSVCPQLRDCTQPIDMILSDLTTSMWAVGLGHLFKSRQIRTIADFAALTELEIDALPLKTPKLATVRAVLATILAAWQRRDNNATDNDVTSHLEKVEPAVQDSAIPAIAASPEKMLPSADAVIDTDSPLSKGSEDKINSSIEGELLLDTSNTSVEQSDQSESAVTVQTEADAPKINESRASDSGFNSDLSTMQSVDSVCHQGAEGVSSLVDLIAKFSEEHSAYDLSRLPSDQIFKLHADLLKLTSSAVVALQKKCASAEETS
ncbi:uncharacterized protein LOC141912105 [Tubulanus polymorphus]|uniref:uncharacterized protein LOC141912105 n=1 Tax=Tubulanus polymorphus TaxID=672921 RepID=UPI003DA64A48